MSDIMCGSLLIWICIPFRAWLCPRIELPNFFSDPPLWRSQKQSMLFWMGKKYNRNFSSFRLNFRQAPKKNCLPPFQGFWDFGKSSETGGKFLRLFVDLCMKLLNCWHHFIISNHFGRCGVLLIAFLSFNLLDSPPPRLKTQVSCVFFWAVFGSGVGMGRKLQLKN